MQETVLTRYLTTLVDTIAADYGLAEDRLYEAAGIAAPNTDRISEAEAEALWVAAEGAATDGLLGLKVGARVRYSTYSTLGHLLVTSKTVGDSLKAACDLAFYVGAAGRLRMAEAGDECAIVYEPLKHNWRAAFVRSEAVLLPMARFARWASPGVVPIRVQLMRPMPDNPAAFENAFGASVLFGADSHALVWAREAMDRPMNDANPALNEMLRAHVEAEMPKAGRLAARVRAYLAAEIGAEDPAPTIADAAKAVIMSERSLQRALADEGVTFRDLLGEARRAAAERLLRETTMPISEIALRLGYSEPAAFVRAFSRWLGCSPAQWRKERRPTRG